jgi:hypothetical protein
MKNAQETPLSFTELWQNAHLKVTDEFTAPPVILQVGDSVVGTLGNFSASTGKAKSKKNVQYLHHCRIGSDKRHNIELCLNLAR